MEFLIYIFPMIVILYIIHIISKYSGTEQYEKVYMEYYRDKNFTEYSPIVWSYIVDKKFKKQSIIATVLLYVQKGYISITKKNNDYEFKIIKTIKDVNELDMWAIGLFFIDKTHIGSIQYLSDFNRYMWIEKTFGEFRKFQKKADDTIKKYLNKEKIINYVDEKVNKDNIIFSYVIIIITLIFTAILSTNVINTILMSIFFLVGYSLLIVVIENSNLTLLTHGTVFFAAYFGMGVINKYSFILLITALLTFLLIYIDNKILRVKGTNGEVIEKALGLNDI